MKEVQEKYGEHNQTNIGFKIKEIHIPLENHMNIKGHRPIWRTLVWQTKLQVYRSEI